MKCCDLQLLRVSDATSLQGDVEEGNMANGCWLICLECGLPGTLGFIIVQSQVLRLCSACLLRTWRRNLKSVPSQNYNSYVFHSSIFSTYVHSISSYYDNSSQCIGDWETTPKTQRLKPTICLDIPSPSIFGLLGWGSRLDPLQCCIRSRWVAALGRNDSNLNETFLQSAGTSNC